MLRNTVDSTISNTHLLVFVSFVIMCGCAKPTNTIVIQDNSTKEKSTFIATTIVDPSAQCENGGVRIDNGIDENSDAQLSNEEPILQSKLICNPAIGMTTLVKYYDEPVSESCSLGGKRIIIGVDLDGDSVLGIEEIADTEIWCGANRQASAVTVAQTQDQRTSRVYDEPVGNNCSTGGKRIANGVDGNSDGILDVSEIEKINYVCNGTNELIRIFQEDAGENCTMGGKRIVSGIDLNNDSQLEESEISDTQYVCDGKNTETRTQTMINETLFCSGPLEGWPDFVWNYKLSRYTSGDVIVTATVTTPASSMNNFTFYSATELKTKKPAAVFVYDVKGTANWGTWKIYLDDVTATTYVAYIDDDLVDQTNSNNIRVWSMPVNNCVKQSLN